MGAGKKNKRGGAPKMKGRLQAVLAEAQAKSLQRSKAAAAAADAEQRKKNGAAGVGAAARKQRRAEAKDRIRRGLPARQPDLEAVGSGDEGSFGELSEDEDDEASRVAAELKARKALKPRKRGTIPFAPGERVLLVGEGNFSFASSLLTLSPPVISPSLLTATAFDTLLSAREKYPDVDLHVNALRAAGATVLFGVDATRLEKTQEVKGMEWDRVVFNFPHTGQGITDQARNVRANQILLLQFLRSVAPLLRKGIPSVAPATKKGSSKGPGKKGKRARDSDNSDDEEAIDEEDVLPLDEENVDPRLALVPPPPKTNGTVLITLRTSLPYSLWSVPHLGTKGPLLAPSILPRPLPKGPQPTYKIKRSFDFNLLDYPGYEHRRTLGYVAGVSSGANEDLTLSARERGLKRREEKEAKERAEKEERGNGAAKGTIRTTEFELVPGKEKSQDEEDFEYDDYALQKSAGEGGMRRWGQ